jgi:hypothetical protein
LPEPTIVGIALIAMAVGAFVLRLVAARQPALRPWATLATLVMLAVLVLVIGLLAWSVVGSYADRLPN